MSMQTKDTLIDASPALARIVGMDRAALPAAARIRKAARGLLTVASVAMLLGAEATTQEQNSQTPVVIKRVSPEYPAELMKQLTNGEALLECLVDTEGRAQEIKVISESHEGFGRAAVTALEQWEFTPGTVNACPTPVRISVPFVFELFPEKDLERVAGRQVFFDVSDPVIPAFWLAAWPRPKANYSPRYPRELEGSGKHGRAVVNITIDREGKVINPRVVESAHPEFALPSLITALKLEFLPQVIANREGIYVNLDVQFNFEEAEGDRGRPRKEKAAPAVRQKPKVMEAKGVDRTPLRLRASGTHMVFIIDSSGSMRDPHSERIRPIVHRKFDEVLDSCPDVKGIQFLDANGRFILGGRQSAERWLPNNETNRAAIKKALFDYDVFSNSNPGPGIVRAMRSLHNADDADMRMAIVILGDEFTGETNAALKRLDELNPRDEAGKRKVVINAIGFPPEMNLGHPHPYQTFAQYANLMWEVCSQHGGSFIALSRMEENER